MPWFVEWRAAHAMRRGTVAYVSSLMCEPAEVDVTWLCDRGTDGDADRAQWELRYAKRAMGVIVAQRDALDDRTASLVLRELVAAMKADRHVAASMVSAVERQFNERLSAYRSMMALKGRGTGPADRLGQTLLMLSGATRVGADEAERAVQVMSAFELEANASLRRAFGEATAALSET